MPCPHAERVKPGLQQPFSTPNGQTVPPGTYRLFGGCRSKITIWKRNRGRDGDQSYLGIRLTPRLSEASAVRPLGVNQQPGDQLLIEKPGEERLELCI